MEIKYQFWLENDGEVVFSKTCEELLRYIDELHSLYAATKLLKRSYRDSWGKLKASEERLGFRLVEKKGPGKGLSLTTEARAILEIIDKIELNVASFINRKNLSSESNMSKIVKTKNAAAVKGGIIIPSAIHGTKSGSILEERSIRAAV